MTNLDGETIDTCADCGVGLNVGRERGYVAGERVICWACALERGGSFDSNKDRWTVAPRTDDLSEDEYRVR